MSTDQRYTQFQNEDDKMGMYNPQANAPPGYSPQEVHQTAYGPPMGQVCAPPPPVNVMMSAPQTQTIISTIQTMPNDHFGLALFVFLCCCWPLGIVALIKSSDVRNRYNAGDVSGANEASEEVRKFSMIGLGIGIACAVTTGLVFIILMVVFSASGY